MIGRVILSPQIAKVCVPQELMKGFSVATNDCMINVTTNHEDCVTVELMKDFTYPQIITGCMSLFVMKIECISSQLMTGRMPSHCTTTVVYR